MRVDELSLKFIWNSINLTVSTWFKGKNLSRKTGCRNTARYPVVGTGNSGGTLPIITRKRTIVYGAAGYFSLFSERVTRHQPSSTQTRRSAFVGKQSLFPSQLSAPESHQWRASAAGFQFRPRRARLERNVQWSYSSNQSENGQFFLWMFKEYSSILSCSFFLSFMQQKGGKTCNNS